MRLFAQRLRRGAIAVICAFEAGCYAVNGASSAAIPAVKLQASTDFDCPQREIRVTKEWSSKFEVVGCGQKATYDASCDGLRCTAAPLGQVVPWAARPDPTPNGATP